MADVAAGGPAAATAPNLRYALGVLIARRTTLIALCFLALLVLVAIFAPQIAPFHLDEDVGPPRTAPSLDHLFGIDHLGRDIFSRLLYGTRISLWAGVLAVSVALGFGTLLGLVAGYFGGWIDSLIMRAMDIAMALPYVLLAILIAVVLGPSLENGILAIGLVRIPRFARLTRAGTLAVKQLPFIEASHALGSPSWRIIWKDIVPNIMGPVIVYATLSLGDAILNLAVLSFLGLGAQPPTPEWGAMLNEAQKYITSAPFMSIFPGIAILLAVLSFNVVGDGLRDVLDPKSRR